MKYILLFILLFSFWIHPAVCQDDCYIKLRNEGDRLFRRAKYDPALKKYLAALNCDQINQVEIARLIIKAQKARESELIRERTAAEVNALNAQSILENKQGKDPTRACTYAYQAWKKDPQNLNSWGNFLEAYYSQTYYWEGQYYSVPFSETYYQAGSLTAADLSPDGKSFVTGSADPPLVKIWTRETEDVLSLTGFANTISRLRYSPDGSTIAIASLDGNARLLNTDGSVKARLFGHKSSILDISFSADGEQVITASIDHSAMIWEATNGDSICRMVDPLQSPLTSANFSPDRKKIMTTHLAGHANIWDGSGKHLHTLLHGSEVISAGAFFQQNPYCITVSEDHTAKVWTSKGQLVDSVSHPQAINGLALSPDDSLIITYSKDGLVKIWNTKGQVQKTFQAHSEEIMGARFSSEGNYFLTFSRDQFIKVWRLNGELMFSLGGFTGAVLEAGFSKDNEFIYASSWDNSAKIFPLTSHKLATYPKSKEPVQVVSLSPNGEKIMGVSINGPAYLWENGRIEQLDFGTDVGWIYGMEFDPISERAVVLTDSGAILWDVDKEQWQILSHPEVRSAQFFDGGNKLVTGSDDGSLKIWNLDDRSFEIFDEIEGHIYDLQISPQEDYLVTGHTNGRVALWNISEKKKSWAQGYHNGETVNHVCFSHDGLNIISSSSDDRAFIWNLKGDPINAFNHSAAVLSASFSQDDQFLLTHSSDGTAKYWKIDQAEREALKTFKMPGTVTVAAFSRDENLIVTGCRDGIVRFWSLNGQLLCSLSASAGSISHLQLSPDSDWLLTVGSDGRIHKWDLSPQRLFSANDIINRD